jgi:hypothetical protein
LLEAILAAWVANAALTTLLMAHRGHSWFQWAIISGALGPFSWPLAAFTLWFEESPDIEPPSEVDVLVTIPPWLRSPEPIVDVVRAFEPLARTATLASVLEVEDATTVAGREKVEELDALLVRCGEALMAEGLVEPPVERRILYGRPADELARFAAAGGFRAIISGPDAPRGHHLLHGHTRTRLQRLAGVPVYSPRR